MVKELIRTQGLLSATVELDKDQATLHQADITRLQMKIKQAYSESSNLNSKIKTQNNTLIKLQENSFPQGLTAAHLDQFNRQVQALKKETADDDNMTEFSVVTDETDIGPIENLLDLRISTAHLDRA